MNLEPLSWGTWKPWSGVPVKAGNLALDNGVIQIRFQADGTVAGWTDCRTGRELLKAPAAFRLYSDKGNAWNIEPGTYDAAPLPGLKLIKQTIEADGPVGYCRQEYSYRQSGMNVEFRLNEGASTCEIFVVMDWHEPEHLMRFELPGTVDADKAQYASQYGFEEFSTRSETSIERAQYEIAAQRWVRIADKELALSLISDCKYGFSVKNGQLNITLLRSAERPGSFVGKDDEARGGNAQYNDLGHHEFAFAFAVDHGDVAAPVEIAEWLNRTPEAVPEPISAPGQWLPWNSRQFAVSMVRQAWQGGGTLLRVYERLGQKGRLADVPGISLTAVRPDGRPTAGVSATDFHPFEIKTLRVE